MLGQPLLNERYDLGRQNSILGSVIATDSCYYATATVSNDTIPSIMEIAFIRYNLNGSLHTIKIFGNDTMHLDVWEKNNLIRTLDGNFAQIARAQSFSSSPGVFMFIKFNPLGDTLFTKIIDEFYIDDLNEGLAPSAMIQNTDSSYTCLINTENTGLHLGGVVFFKLDKNGNLIFHKNFYGLAVDHDRVLTSSSLVSCDDTSYLIGTTLINQAAYDVEVRYHTKLIKVNTLGDLIQDWTYWEDSLSYGCNSLTKTMDGGYLYCGRNGHYFSDFNGVFFKGRVVKLKPDFSVDWDLLVGKYGEEWVVNLTTLKAVNDSEFVAVGTIHPEDDTLYNKFGWFIKFNLKGELLWQRKWLKVPHFDGEINYAGHQLYDMDITQDGGFVAVGQSINYYEDNGIPYGQLAWLIKTDEFGCIVPGCNLDAAEYFQDNPSDTINSSMVVPEVNLYPNPASTVVNYYHHQDDFDSTTVAMVYDPAGQIVQKWPVLQNDVTYIVDVSDFTQGVYVLKVVGTIGVLRTERFVVTR